MKRSLPDWLPRSVLTFSEGYTRTALTADLIAGVTVGLVALPLAMAFAIASGLTPQAGIYCAIITGFIISALGGSRFQIGGPTGAFVVVVSGIVAEYGVDGLFMCTLMAGVILVVMGLTGTGTAVKYIPKPVIIGFTNGIALDSKLADACIDARCDMLYVSLMAASDAAYRRLHSKSPAVSYYFLLPLTCFKPADPEPRKLPKNGWREPQKKRLE